MLQIKVLRKRDTTDISALQFCFLHVKIYWICVRSYNNRDSWDFKAYNCEVLYDTDCWHGTEHTDRHKFALLLVKKKKKKKPFRIRFLSCSVLCCRNKRWRVCRLKSCQQYSQSHKNETPIRHICLESSCKTRGCTEKNKAIIRDFTYIRNL